MWISIPHEPDRRDVHHQPEGGWNPWLEGHSRWDCGIYRAPVAQWRLQLAGMLRLVAPRLAPVHLPPRCCLQAAVYCIACLLIALQLPNECPRALTLLCLVYCAGRVQSCFLTILRIRISSASLTRLAPASCTLYPEFYTYTP